MHGIKLLRKNKIRKQIKYWEVLSKDKKSPGNIHLYKDVMKLSLRMLNKDIAQLPFEITINLNYYGDHPELIIDMKDFLIEKFRYNDVARQAAYYIQKNQPTEKIELYAHSKKPFFKMKCS